MTELTADLAALSMLTAARLQAADYYAPLLDSDDAVQRVGAWCALIDREDVRVEQYPRLVELSSYGAIQARAFRFFQSNWEHDLAAAVMAKVATTEAAATALAMRADLACDDLAAVEAQRYRFLATGRFEALAAMVSKTEQAMGWRSALSLAVKVFVLKPHDPLAANLVLRQLHNARQSGMLAAVITQLDEANLHPYLARLYSAACSIMDGDSVACLQRLESLKSLPPPRPDLRNALHQLPSRLAAEAHEHQGDYRKAYAAFVEVNRADSDPRLSLEHFGKVILSSAALDVPELPPDPRANHYVMTGFPRSGTTLLENALAMHPDIETFEETPTRSSMQLYLDQALPGVTDEATRTDVFVRSRARYYDEMDRRQRKLDASVFIDKMPLRSAEAGFLAKVFPDKRYIFSIRHPFDVVLSCFKQYFARNIAMEHFRQFDTAAALYDFTMSQWFGVFSLSDPRVHYLRYDELVTDFEGNVRRALDFLGTDWNPAVLDFARGADVRSARTPSYQKVRQGLSIGVQSSWRNYNFLFESEAARPLYRWAEFFGYPTR